MNAPMGVGAQGGTWFHMCYVQYTLENRDSHSGACRSNGYGGVTAHSTFCRRRQ